jgi:hypothetical protein
MKKKISISLVIFLLVFVALNIFNPSANASVYVKVDANGVAIDGPIMCDSGTCGEGSLFSRLTLKDGERYVLQGTGSAGIGGNNPDTQVKVDSQNVWTVTNTQTNTVVQQFTPQTSPGNDRPTVYVPPIIDTQTVVVDTKTATVDTKTVVVDTKTATVSNKNIVSMSNVIWAMKNQILEIKALVAKIMIRTRGK